MERVFVAALRLMLMLVLPQFALAAAPAFDFQALRTLIETRQIDSIEALLPELPAELRSRYVLVFSSRSLQQASFRDPRAILYGSDAQLVISFNGDPAQRGYQAIETAEYDSEQSRFRFREIAFGDSAPGASGPRFSEVDPPRCQRCHGNPTRPVWDASPLWPGAYGERYRANLTSIERAGVQLFLARQRTHPRYRHLLLTERFALRATYAPDARIEYQGQQPEPPNAEFAMLLGRMNVQMIARQLRAAPGFDRFQYALLGAAEGTCGELTDFLPAALRPAVRPALLRFLAAAASNARTQEEAKQLRALHPGSGLHLNDGQMPSAAMGALRFLAEAALDLPTQDWTLALEKGTYEFQLRDAGGARLRDALRAAVAQGAPELDTLHSASEYSTDDRYCADLRRRSIAALGLLGGSELQRLISRQSTDAQLASAPEATLKHCASCHADGPAPPLPFDQPQAIGALLRVGGYPHGDLLSEILFRLSPQAGAGRMPLDALLTPAQREQLSRYLTGLARAP